MSTLTLSDMFGSDLPIDLSHHSKDIQAATVYTVTMTHRKSGTRQTFDVLALDSEMAQEMAGIELHADDVSIMDWKFDPPVAKPNASVLRTLQILGSESAECAELREQTFAERQKGVA